MTLSAPPAMRPTEPPAPVRLAFRLALLYVGLETLNSVVYNAARRDWIHPAGPFPAWAVASGFGVFLLADVAFELFLIFRMRRGAKWARTLLTIWFVFGAIGYVQQLSLEGRGAGWFQEVNLVIQGLVVLLGLVCLFLLYARDARPWFYRGYRAVQVARR